MTRVVQTSLGPVECALSAGEGEVVLFFPGGHTTAATPLGTDIYTELGYRTLTFSRPGYGRTRVGPLTAAQFVPAVVEVCQHLDIAAPAATVGLSFGGLQAVHLAVDAPALSTRLILHSCAPSSLPYPDSTIERWGAPLLFKSPLQHATWLLIRGLTASDWGLRLMMRQLSTLPVRAWWDLWTAADKSAARQTFAQMESGTGFRTDLRQAVAAESAHRRAVLESVRCPTLVTASTHDGGVAFKHAQDFVHVIPDCRLITTEAWTHFAWLGPSRLTLSTAVREFLTA